MIDDLFGWAHHIQASKVGMRIQNTEHSGIYLVDEFLAIILVLPDAPRNMGTVLKRGESRHQR